MENYRGYLREVIVSLETLEKNGLSGGTMERSAEYGNRLTLNGKEYEPIQWYGNGWLCREYSGDYEII